MNVVELIRIGCAKKNWSLAELARHIEWTPQNLSNKIKHNDFRISEIETVFNALELTIKVFDKDGKEL